MNSRTITAVYDTQAEAERAVEALAAQGIPRSDLRIHRDMPVGTGSASAENTDKGFWASLADLFVPDDDGHTYAEALRRGSVMVSARVDDAHYEAAADLMEAHGAVDLDERESSWRSEGWTGGERGLGQTRAGTAAAGNTAGDTATRMAMASDQDHVSHGERGIGQTRTGAAAAGTSAADTATRMSLATDGASENGGLMSRNMDELTGSARTGARPGGYTGQGDDIGQETGLAPGDQGKPGTAFSRGVDEVVGTNISGAHPENETSLGGVASHTFESTGSSVGDASLGGSSTTGSPMGGSSMGGTTMGTDGTEAIPVVEETLRVGKREVSGGRVRVRSYVVETPVEEQVSLRHETVDVQRRAVDRPVTDADRLFQDRTIEATETSEEAVIAKEARVKEEVVISKDAEQRTETVHDTVRRTEVEVERDGPGTGTNPRRV
jgi:uncharacterized protein (TIGR02271 family)